MSLAGRVAIVTGAASGMGAATADALAAAGAEILAVDLPGKAPPPYRHADRIRPFGADLGRADDLAGIAAELRSAYGALDILVNNAGIVGATGADPFGSPDNLHAVMAINVEAAWALTRLVIEDLKKSKAGRIINVGSVNSEFPAPGGAAYVASKHALYGLTKCWALDLGRFGITVNAVLPGATDTPMSRAFQDFAAWEAHAKAKSPLGRLGTPQDVADAIAFLASDAAGFITGHGLYVDGGLHLGI